MKRKATEQEMEVFTYLNELRESGETNMFGARPYIMVKFPHLNSDEAKKILSLWMANYNEDCNYEEITDKTLVA